MLADRLQELSLDLMERCGARGLMPPPGRKPMLLPSLLQTLREGRVDVSFWLQHADIEVDVKAMLHKLRVFRECVYETIEANAVPVTVREMSLLSEWFVAINAVVYGEETRRFNALLDALPDFVALDDAEGRIVHLNRAAAEDMQKLTGLGADELIGRNFFELGLPQKITRRGDTMVARPGKGESNVSEVLFPGPSGARWREEIVRPVFTADGKLEAFAIASRDIHARKVAESRLQLLSKVGTLAENTAYEEVLSAVARLSIPELADWCVIDIVDNGEVRRGKVAHADPTKVAIAEEILATSPKFHQKPMAQHILDGGSFLIPEIDLNKLEEKAADPRYTDIVRRLGARSVMVVPFVVLGTPVALATFVLTPESGRRHGPDDLALAEEMARRAAQIIENARLHEQLRQSETRFRVALEHSNIAVFEEDVDLRVRWLHNARFGLAPEEAIDRVTGDFFPIETSTELDAIKRRVIASGVGARTAVDTLFNGERRHLLINYEPLRDAGGEVVGITGAAVDITEAKRAEEELSRSLAFREQMIGVLGHDLRNPLSAVLALSGLLQQNDGLPDKVHEGLGRIRQAAQRMNEMIATLLDFTQVRFRGGLPVSVESVDLGALVRGAIDELRAAHPRCDIRVEIDGDLRGQWDPGRMAQVVSNLVGNALTHGAHDAPVLLTLASDEAQVRLCVTNRGPAIPAELTEQMFEPFRQGPRHNGSERARGLGLGLFIVRQIVEAHGGKIDVRSDDDATTFTVRLQRCAS